MYRFTFTKVEFLKQTTSLQVLIQVETQNGDRYRTKQKKIKNNVAKFYGDFIEFQKEYCHFCIKIIQTNDKKILCLRQKLNLKHDIIQQNQKKSHIIQTGKIRIHFESQIIFNGDSNNEQTVNDFSTVKGKIYMSNRLKALKFSRQLSSGSKKNQKRLISIQSDKRIISKSFSIYQKV